MQRNPVLLCSALLAFWPLAGASAASDLVSNGGFESDGGTPTTALGWEFFSVGGTAERRTTMPHTGLAQAHIEGDPLLGANFAVVVQRDRPVDPGKSYGMGFFAKAPAIAGTIGFRVEFYDAGNNLIGGLFDNNVLIDGLLTSTYQPFGSTFTAPANAATGTLVMFWEGLTGFTSVDFDDVTFIAAPIPIPTVSEWGLIVMAVLGMVGGVIVFRRAV